MKQLFVTSFLLVAASVFAADYPANCFTQMGNDRVLLMNNDGAPQCPITLQSYYDTNTTESTYWTHYGDQRRCQLPFRI